MLQLHLTSLTKLHSTQTFQNLIGIVSIVRVTKAAQWPTGTKILRPLFSFIKHEWSNKQATLEYHTRYKCNVTELFARLYALFWRSSWKMEVGTNLLTPSQFNIYCTLRRVLIAYIFPKKFSHLQLSSHRAGSMRKLIVDSGFFRQHSSKVLFVQFALQTSKNILYESWTASIEILRGCFLFSKLQTSQNRFNCRSRRRERRQTGDS